MNRACTSSVRPTMNISRRLAIPLRMVGLISSNTITLSVIPVVGYTCWGGGGGAEGGST